MIQHDLIQGSSEWHAYRAKHFNASDAPAMMGVSPYKTRTQLLQEYATGFKAEVDAGTQALYDNGHRFEALARPRAEAIAGEDFYPVVGSNGMLSASFDGLTMAEDVAFEHKTLNADLRASIRQQGGNANDFLAPFYRVQMEQQCMVADCSRVLFMASKWTADGTLVEERHCWYTPDPELRAKIVAGWKQFEADLAAYAAPAAAAPPPVGRAPDSLPALRVTVNGAVTASNIAEFKEVALAAIRSVNRELSTDVQFADAEKAVKWCEDIEQRIAASKDHILSQAEDIYAALKTLDDIDAESSTTRIALKKLIASRKAQIRDDEIARGQRAAREHIEALNERLGERYMPPIPHDFAGAIKNLRTVESLRNAIDTTIANFKITANEVADRIQANMKALVAAGDSASFPDAAALVLKQPDDLAAVIAQRVAAERERIQAKAAALAAQQAAQPAPAAAPIAPPAAPAVTRPAADNEPATLGVGGVNIYFGQGLTMTAEFIENTLGVKRDGEDPKRKTPTWRGSTLNLIAMRLSEHADRLVK